MFEILVTSSTIFRSDVRFFPHEFPPWKWTERIIQSVLTAQSFCLQIRPRRQASKFLISSLNSSTWNSLSNRSKMGDQVIPVKVASRIRPLSEMELGNGCQDVISVVPGRPQIVFKNSDKAFTYDYAFGQVIMFTFKPCLMGPLFYFFTSPSLPALHSLHCPLLGVPLTLVVGLCRTSTWMCSLQEHVPTLWASTPRGPNQTQLNRPIPMPNNFCIFGLILLKEFYF